MKTYKKIIGFLAVIVGIVALVTPFTPGASFFIFIGLNILGVHFAFLDKIESFLLKRNKKSTINTK